jgi:hypothetical protein
MKRKTSRFTVSETRLLLSLLRDPDSMTLSDAYCDLASFHRALEMTGSRVGRRNVMRRIDTLESIAVKLKTTGDGENP